MDDKMSDILKAEVDKIIEEMSVLEQFKALPNELKELLALGYIMNKEIKEYNECRNNNKA